MSVFWLIVLLLLLAASSLILIAGWRDGRSSLTDRDTLNKAFYRQRLQELEEESAQGVVGEQPDMVRELQQMLLMDIPETPPPTGVNRVGRWALFVGVALMVVISSGLYYQIGGWVQVSAWQQVNSELPTLRAHVMDPHAKPLTMEEMARLGLGIRSELQHDPANLAGWMMLGRIGLLLNNAQTATQAFQRALQLAPDNEEVKLSYADVLTRSSDPQDNREASNILRVMLKNDHSNLQVLSLMAFNAFEQQHYDQAIGAWQVMLALLPADDRRVMMINSSIARAKTAAGQQQNKLVVTVSLAADAEKMLTEGGVMYISVTDGVSPLPVAATKLPLSRFPLSLTLDDSNTLVPDRLLSSRHHVKVRVRLSRDGEESPQSGDWYGESVLTPYDGHQHLAVEINQQQP